MKYSVITPHYKDLKGLNRLLKSLPRRNDIEVVIVDDNSDINTNVLSELVREYKGIYYSQMQMIISYPVLLIF
jgi:glycosyltransferase involved in cell wall biosynthesis